MQMNELPLHDPAAAHVVPVLRVRAAHAAPTTDQVACEVAVALEFNGVSHAVMLATPQDLEDFARGFALTEGIVDAVSQIYGMDIDVTPRGHVVRVEVAASCFARLKDRRRSMAGRTGCGLCGTDNLDHAVRPVAPLETAAHFGSAAVLRGVAAIQQGQHLQHATGATHAAAWCNAQGEVVLLREDVGRHNALDKLIGALLVSGHVPAQGFVVVTSRASYEMVHKTATAGVAVLAAVSGVTSLAVGVAQQARLALLGFVRGRDLSVYSHAQRIELDTSVG